MCPLPVGHGPSSAGRVRRRCLSVELAMLEIQRRARHGLLQGNVRNFGFVVLSSFSLRRLQALVRRVSDTVFPARPIRGKELQGQPRAGSG